MARTRWIAVALVLVTAVWLHPAAQAVTIRSDRSDSQYLALGTNYPSVGRIDGMTAKYNFLASGTLIASDWVLTAAHVVDQTTSLTFQIGGKSYAADQMIANPGWTGDLWAGYDIAMVHLNGKVPDITPAKLYDGSAEAGKVGTAVGYGMTGTGNTGAKKLDYNKRGAQNSIDLLSNNGRLLFSDFDSPRFNFWSNSMGSSKPLDLEGLIAPGDSGGGVFIDEGNGPELAGVNSFVGSWHHRVDSSYGDMSGHTRVSYFTDWIDSVLNGTANTSALRSTNAWYGATAVVDPLPVPEPGTLALLASGAVVLLLAARRLRRGR
jgi:hypothetical protein